MLTNRVALAIVGGLCVVSAGTGGYLASRYAGGADPVSTTAAATSREVGPETVHETEAVIEQLPAPVAPSAESAPAAPAAASPAREATVKAPREPEARRAPREVPRRQAASARGEAPAPPPAPRTPPPEAAQPKVMPEPQVPRTAELPVTEPVPPMAGAEVPRQAETAREPERRFEELVVPSDSVIGLQLERSVSSETARIEDDIEARVTRDVRVAGEVAIPAGSRALGSVTVVERGGKVKERARLGVRFHTLVLADGTRLPLQTETVYREGDSPASSSSAKIGGGAIGGAIIGAILGGGKGAVIGGTTGAAGGTAAVMAGGRRPAVMPSGSTVTVRVLSPVTVTVEQ